MNGALLDFLKKKLMIKKMGLSIMASSFLLLSPVEYHPKYGACEYCAFCELPRKGSVLLYVDIFYI